MSEFDPDDDYIPDTDYDKDVSCVIRCEDSLATCINQGSALRECEKGFNDCSVGCDRSTVVGC